MAVLAVCGDVVALSAGSVLTVVPLRGSSSRPFFYDCSTAERKPLDNKSEDDVCEGQGSDRILAAAFSASGNYFALTDDNKRLILFCTKPSWKCISIRAVVRRCSSLTITLSEDRIFVADKSGDVYSFAIAEPQKKGQLELGHLSMLLDVAVSPDDKYIITADRDEKIRVSLLKAPHNIASFCLGHREFVSRILVLPNAGNLLLSSSGDSTLRLWEYEEGREVQCCDLTSYSSSGGENLEKKIAVSRIIYCRPGNFIAVLCDSFPVVYLFQFDIVSQRLIHTQSIPLKHRGWDIAFDAASGLWVLQEDKDEIIALYRLVEGQWQAFDDKELKKISTIFRERWALLQECLGGKTFYGDLYKSTHDNMASYLSKKRERQEQMKKRKGKHLEENKHLKKLKTETPSSCL
ncbi:tRNA (guanine-N(7)-)-methyltransferase non-catalytic subunit WDR4 isoform X2 [Rhinatrema bivittatum]|uniref:tRNA (guanine-N(7)-)-methyltransferase non-catalytic subunit WDR4 isoform X2 n=1 Tax=Rhinatrema bivittatum TaxID=194408 RepID=UPI00112C1E45|nr:tRNA (guanine-N(7)-)-methyltransferase non-catalytic subunit WDR4 isoform X2 [Rhinatrema bivittatum]